jgi:hypothetical protein
MRAGAADQHGALYAHGKYNSNPRSEERAHDAERGDLVRGTFFRSEEDERDEDRCADERSERGDGHEAIGECETFAWGVMLAVAEHAARNAARNVARREDTECNPRRDENSAPQCERREALCFERHEDDLRDESDGRNCQRC